MYAEHDEQVTLMKWWSYAHSLFGVPEQLLFAIPNGGDRNILVAAKLKAEGVRAGVPDLFLAVPRGRYHGMFIELKKRYGGTVSKKQKLMIEILIVSGYCSLVCHGWNGAVEAIKRYLEGDME